MLSKPSESGANFLSAVFVCWTVDEDFLFFAFFLKDFLGMGAMVSSTMAGARGGVGRAGEQGKGTMMVKRCCPAPNREPASRGRPRGGRTFS